MTAKALTAHINKPFPPYGICHSIAKKPSIGASPYPSYECRKQFLGIVAALRFRHQPQVFRAWVHPQVSDNITNNTDQGEYIKVIF